MKEETEITIYADESCLGNQFHGSKRPGGAAGMLEYQYEGLLVRKDYWIYEPDTTNNRMALKSAIVGLGHIGDLPRDVRFVSDSQYLIKGMTDWINSWKNRNWKRKSGKIENLSLWQDLDRIVTNHQIDWEWVRGHDGHSQNEYVDHLATTAAKTGTNSHGLVDSNYLNWTHK
ncbi:MAG: ribonuclease HI [Gemmatimonadetes bacterium]|jgi:ribonuclease HI|nr:ribonuclease HI [Gemmatimonadota bacterium]|tara:strand:- start:282 stop:800 length:519 start_codon:yes stop_codon:yes gene_type:complete